MATSEELDAAFNAEYAGAFEEPEYDELTYSNGDAGPSSAMPSPSPSRCASGSEYTGAAEELEYDERIYSNLGSGPSSMPSQSPSRFASGLDRERSRRSHLQLLRTHSTLRWLETRTPKPQGTSAPSSPRMQKYSMAVTVAKFMHGHGATCLAFSPDSAFIATAARDVRVWEADTGKLRVILDAHAGLVRSLAFTADGRWLVSGSDDATIKVWDMYRCMDLAADKIVTLTPPGSPCIANPLGVPPPGSQLTHGSQMQLGSRAGSVTSSGGKGGAAAAAGKAAANAQHVAQALVPGKAGASSSAAGGGGHAGLEGVAPPKDGPPPSPLSKVVTKILRRHHKAVLALTTSADSKQCFSASADKTVRVWDLGSGYCTATLRGHRQEVTCVARTPDGKTVVSGSSDRMILFWNTATGECIRTIKGHKGPVSCIAMASCGTWMVSGGHDKALRVWDMSTGDELAVLAAHEGTFGVLSVAISKDGSLILSGGYDRALKLWDANSGHCVQALEGHKQMVDCVAFSPDGGSIASTARDDFTRAWAWQTEEEWKEAQAAATAEAAKKAAMCGKAAAPASPARSLSYSAGSASFASERYRSGMLSRSATGLMQHAAAAGSMIQRSGSWTHLDSHNRRGDSAPFGQHGQQAGQKHQGQHPGGQHQSLHPSQQQGTDGSTPTPADLSASMAMGLGVQCSHSRRSMGSGHGHAHGHGSNGEAGRRNLGHSVSAIEQHSQRR